MPHKFDVEQRHFDERAESRDDQRRKNDPAPESLAKRSVRKTYVGAEAYGKCAEDDRQTAAARNREEALARPVTKTLKREVTGLIPEQDENSQMPLQAHQLRAQP